VDPAAVPYVSRFEAQFNIKSMAEVILVDEIPLKPSNSYLGKFIGLCSRGEANKFLVRLKRSYFETATDLMREQLVYHELAHCALHKQVNHDDREVDGVPLSIMHPTIISEYYYNLNHKQYIKDLAEKLEVPNEIK
jgi:hypothetical protein